MAQLRWMWLVLRNCSPERYAVNKERMVPVLLTKSPQTLVESGATVAYPPETSAYHYEMELVLVIGKPGSPCGELGIRRPASCLRLR